MTDIGRDRILQRLHKAAAQAPAMAAAPEHEPGRNDPCYCGSGKKFKHCCMR